jgi:hypothetical protein
LRFTNDVLKKFSTQPDSCSELTNLFLTEDTFKKVQNPAKLQFTNLATLSQVLIDEAQLAGQMGGNSGKHFFACYLHILFNL